MGIYRYNGKENGSYYFIHRDYIGSNKGYLELKVAKCPGSGSMPSVCTGGTKAGNC